MHAVDLRRPRLLPPTQARAARWRRAVAALVALDLLTVAAWLGLTAGVRRLEAALAAGPAASAASLDDLAARRQGIQARLQALMPLENAPAWAPLLEAIAAARPGDVAMAAASGALDANGLTLQVTGDAPTLAAVASYMKNLQQIAGVRSIRFENSVRKKEGGLRFRLSLAIAPPHEGSAVR